MSDPLPPETVILEEDFDEDYEPTSEEIREYAEALGMDVQVCTCV